MVLAYGVDFSLIDYITSVSNNSSIAEPMIERSSVSISAANGSGSVSVGSGGVVMADVIFVIAGGGFEAAAVASVVGILLYNSGVSPIFDGLVVAATIVDFVR